MILIGLKKNQINKTDSSWPEAERDDSQDFNNPHDDIANKIFGGVSGGARMINMGLGSDEIRHRLYLIWDVAKWAITNGKTEMYVC